MLNVFISWSGSKSQKAAIILEKHIRLHLPGANAFISTDIASGQRWFDVIANRLESSNFGILVVTRANVQSTWLHFEAGALARHHKEATVSLLMLDAKTSDLKSPLSEYQATTMERESLLKLFRTINSRLTEQKRNEADLDEVFEMIWPKLKAELEAVASESDEAESVPIKRTTDDILEELLANSRAFLGGSQFGVNSFEYISGEGPAMQALIDATVRATRMIRATRFFPHAIKNTFPAYADAIADRVLGREYPPLEHYFRIVAANSLEKLKDVEYYIENFMGRSFTLYLTEFTNDFELVIIDDNEVFIHFYGEDLVIESTVRLTGPEIAQRFSRVFTRLHDPKKGAVEKIECRYLNQENVQKHKALAKEFFETHAKRPATKSRASKRKSTSDPISTVRSRPSK